MAKATVEKPHFIKCPDEIWWKLKQIAAHRKETLRHAFIKVVTFYDKREGPTKKRRVR